MALVRLNRVCLAFGDVPIFTDVDFSIEPGERVCLIGRNGAGKTTLLRLVTGTLQPDAGEVALRKDITVSALEQELPADDGLTVREVVAGGLAPLQALVERFEALSREGGARHAAGECGAGTGQRSNPDTGHLFPPTVPGAGTCRRPCLPGPPSRFGAPRPRPGRAPSSRR